MFCFSSEYHNSLAKMFKIPDFDDDVPKTDLSYNKNSTTPNVKVAKAGNKQKTTVKEKNTANNNIVKAKDKISNKKKSKVQKNVQVNNTSKNSFTSKEQNKSKERKHKPNKLQLVASKAPRNIPQTNERVKNVSNKHKNNKLNKNDSIESSLECLESEYSEPNPKKKKIKQKSNFEDFDEELLKVGNKKFNESIKKDDQEAQLQFTFTKPLTKKEKLKNILMMGSNNRNHIKVNSSLREKMLEQLRSAQFRYLNEKLYTSSGKEAQELFQSDPSAFRTYHQGYQQQLRKWPVNPLDEIVKRINSFPITHVIADLGCGEAALSRCVPHTVRSFDLVAASPRVEACDMAHTPLETASVDVVVYCLALMGTELTSYLIEANRILKIGGNLLIAEVESRFDSVEAFTRGIEQLGFKLNKMDQSHRVFFFFEFAKARDPPTKKAKLPQLTLKPCIYKRR